VYLELGVSKFPTEVKNSFLIIQNLFEANSPKNVLNTNYFMTCRIEFLDLRTPGHECVQANLNALQ
jgi:hypothetical protein